jgi:predicted methyltransferase
MKALVVACLFLSSVPAMAQEPNTSRCGKREQVVEKLNKKFGETLRAVGMQADKSVIEIYTSKKTGTWTILASKADGTSCMLSAGGFWMDYSEDESKGDPL